MMKVKEIRVSKLGIQLYVETSSFLALKLLKMFSYMKMRYLYGIEKNIFVAPLSWLQTSIKDLKALPLFSHHCSNPTHSNQWNHVVPEYQRAMRTFPAKSWKHSFREQKKLQVQKLKKKSIFLKFSLKKIVSHIYFINLFFHYDHNL